jgi:hypothetical protein
LKSDPDRIRSKNDANKLPQPKVFIVFTSNFTGSIRGNLDVAKVGIELRFGYGPIDTKD